MQRAHPSTASPQRHPDQDPRRTDPSWTLTIGTGPKRGPVWQRMLASLLAFLLWMGPLEIVWQDAQRSAQQLAPDMERGLAQESTIAWQVFAMRLQDEIAKARWESNWWPVVAMFEEKFPGYLATSLGSLKNRLPSLRFGQRAEAAPISDPAAPIRFQPTITSSSGTGGGVPVVNITAPNAAGISLNQYSQFNVDAIGLILNNSLISGGSTLGGTVNANGALGGRTASQIINQVSTQGSASRIAGTIEVFGAPADVIIANPNGISCTACGFINTPRVVMSTGEPQFLTARGGASASFDSAAALAYNVKGGHIQIEGAAGANGTPGAGIEGSAGVVDLIAGSIGVNASINAGKQINLIAGQQLVSEAVAGQGKIGSDYQLTANGSTPNFSGPEPGVQIDATAFGAMNAGQIKVVGTTAGFGVRVGAANANNGTFTIDASGDVNVGNAYGSQGVGIRGDGSVSANNLTSYGAASVSGAADVAVAKMTAAQDASVSGRNVAIGETVAGGQLFLTASGNIVTGQTGSVVGDARFVAGTSIANTGNWTVGGQLSLNTTTVGNGLGASLSGLAGTSIIATDLRNYGTLYGGAVDVNLSGALDNSFGSLLAKSGMSIAMGRLYSNAGGTIYVGDPNVAANAAPAGSLTMTVSGAGSSINNAGGLIAASDSLNIVATNAAMDLSGALGGQLNASRNLTIAAASISNSGGWLANAANVALSASNGVSNAGVLQASGNLSVSSAGATISNTGAIVAGQDLTFNGALNNAVGAVIHAERNATLNGGVTNAGTIEALNDVTLQGGNVDNGNGTIKANRNFTATGVGTLNNVAGTIAAQGDVSIQAGTINNDRAAPVTVESSSQQVIDVDLAGSTYLGDYKWLSYHYAGPGALYIDKVNTQAINIATYFNGAGTLDASQGTLTVGCITIGTCPPTESRTFLLPIVDQILLRQVEGKAGQILGGNDVTLSASSLSNRGSTISAGRNLVATLDSLQNGSSDTVISYRAGGTVNQASLNAFMQAAQDFLPAIPSFADVPGTQIPSNPFGIALPATGFIPVAQVVAPTNVVETSVLGSRGMLKGGGNVSLNGTGNLVNAGDLVAGNNITITLPGSFVNQGTYQSSFITRPGCLPSALCRENNAHERCADRRAGQADAVVRRAKRARPGVFVPEHHLRQHPCADAPGLPASGLRWQHHRWGDQRQRRQADVQSEHHQHRHHRGHQSGGEDSQPDQRTAQRRHWCSGLQGRRRLGGIQRHAAATWRLHVSGPPERPGGSDHGHRRCLPGRQCRWDVRCGSDQCIAQCPAAATWRRLYGDDGKRSCPYGFHQGYERAGGVWAGDCDCHCGRPGSSDRRCRGGTSQCCGDKYGRRFRWCSSGGWHRCCRRWQLVQHCDTGSHYRSGRSRKRAPIWCRVRRGCGPDCGRVGKCVRDEQRIRAGRWHCRQRCYRNARHQWRDAA